MTGGMKGIPQAHGCAQSGMTGGMISNRLIAPYFSERLRKSLIVALYVACCLCAPACRQAGVACGLLSVVRCLSGAAWGFEDKLLTQPVAQERILTALSKELEPRGFSGVEIRFMQFPEKFSYSSGSELLFEEMSGHRRLGIRRYKISALGERGIRKTAFCAAAVSAEGPDIRARYHIPAGKRIAESDLAVSRVRLDDLPTDAATDPGQVIDQESNRNIGQGARIQLDFLRQPAAVLRGEIIEIGINIGGLAAKVFGEAESSGFVGDRIAFKNTLSLKRFFAKITAPHQAEVIWDGGDKG